MSPDKTIDSQQGSCVITLLRQLKYSTIEVQYIITKSLTNFWFFAIEVQASFPWMVWMWLNPFANKR